MKRVSTFNIRDMVDIILLRTKKANKKQNKFDVLKFLFNLGLVANKGYTSY